jgi:hypothetical protein
LEKRKESSTARHWGRVPVCAPVVPKTGQHEKRIERKITGHFITFPMR